MPNIGKLLLISFFKIGTAYLPVVAGSPGDRCVTGAALSRGRVVCLAERCRVVHWYAGDVCGELGRRTLVVAAPLSSF